MKDQSNINKAKRGTNHLLSYSLHGLTAVAPFLSFLPSFFVEEKKKRRNGDASHGTAFIYLCSWNEYHRSMPFYSS